MLQNDRGLRGEAYGLCSHRLGCYWDSRYATGERGYLRGTQYRSPAHDVMAAIGSHSRNRRPRPQVAQQGSPAIVSEHRPKS